MDLDWLNNLKTDTFAALRFFSTLPLARWFGGEDSLPHAGEAPKLNDAIVGFPIAGLIIALPPALLWYIASQFLSPLLAAAIAIGLGTLITGALHEDGLADCFDGLGGGSTRERILQIMRDSAIGTFGASALFFSFAIRIFALASLGSWSGALALLMAHSVARGALVIAIHYSTYVRPSGLGDAVREGAHSDQFKNTLWVLLAISLALVLASDQFSGLLAPVVGMTASWGLLQWLNARLGGYTGDGLGAMEQVAEISILLVLAALWQ